MAALAMVAAEAEQHVLVDDHKDEPATFARALRNTVVRNVVLENAQLVEALSSSTVERVGVHIIGMVLALSAGTANAIAFAKFKKYVSHVSGVSTAIFVRENQYTPAENVYYFVGGAVLTGLLIPSATLKLGQARYEVVLFLVAAMELVCWWHDLQYLEIIAAAMGLQNAMVASWSGFVLRTTHMTPAATDLGSALGRILSRFLRRGCCLNSYSDQDWDEHIVDRQKFVLMACLLASFIAGGIVGVAAYNSLKIHALLVPAGLTASLGVLHLAYRIMRREPLAMEKAAEQIFTRQLSGAFGCEGLWESAAMLEEGGEVSAEAEEIKQFIRQISHAGATADRLQDFIRQISSASAKINAEEHLIG